MEKMHMKPATPQQKTILQICCAFSGMLMCLGAHADVPAGSDEIQDLFTAITSDYQTSIPEDKVQTVYDNFCAESEIQSAIDYYVIHNTRNHIYVHDIPKILTGVNDTNYVSKSYDMNSRSFPLVDWMYNSITWAGEPMKFYYRVNNSLEGAPIYNITPNRKEKPTGRLVMNFAVGDSYNLLNTGSGEIKNIDCSDKDVNFCPEKLKEFNPFRKIIMITREPDGTCVSNVYHAERVDTEYSEDNLIYRNEIRFHAPHGNFRFKIKEKNWVNEREKISGYFTYELNTLTIDGVKYKMIPGGNPWNISTWYLKGNGEYHEKWLYMYPMGNTDDVYSLKDGINTGKATKVVISIFSNRSFSTDENTKRIVLYPKKKK
jgi:hypothetical protein